jgi:hypothetical protein
VEEDTFVVAVLIRFQMGVVRKRRILLLLLLLLLLLAAVH